MIVAGSLGYAYARFAMKNKAVFTVIGGLPVLAHYLF